MAAAGGRDDCWSAGHILCLDVTVLNRYCHGRTSICGIARWPDSVVSGLFHNDPSGGNRSKLGISWDGPALPEAAFARPRSVVVVWAWAVALLFPVVARNKDLNDSADEEENTEGDVSICSD